MILSDRDIKKYIREGKIKIIPEPNFEKQLGPCSLDLKLGKTFKKFKRSEIPFIDLKTNIPIEKIMSEIKLVPGKPLIMQPGDFIIANTEESFEIPPDLAARIDGRSSLGRLGIVIHITAARFDPGWKGKAVLELGNLGTMPVALYPGMRICAITFETLSSPSEVPYLKQKDHKYAHQKSPRASRVNQEEEFKKEKFI
ncbi:MAG: dCTP deaminase [Candidatus Nealsonbacteria bacterium RBG_13_36_15]|uniref:dCTP deaminase n=1 Tax=Candidatus Nealsonbacteria bacterium RBG_13_36_15 TaxID=1801660 RepID=A0A1G2DUM6_9BACT|nr:MAG: dCTP deaminase [Candidatus Nealsonbacteria bacterium RBG_13_36_15]